MELTGEYNIQTHKDIISIETVDKLQAIIGDYFNHEIMNWVINFDRPIQIKYGNFVERNKGRFEIIPSSIIEKEIWHLLRENFMFSQVNHKIKSVIKSNYPKENVVEELCILPLEGNVPCGNWHRDIYFSSDDVWSKDTYYITQVIYLDNLSDTEFCLDSQNNSDHNDILYEKEIFHAESGWSVSFDGRMIHRGLQNRSSTTRYAIYISYHISSYIDEESVMQYAQFTL